MIKSVKLLLLVAWLTLFSTRLFAFNYTNQELGFSVTLPEGLVQYPSQTKPTPLVSLGRWDNANKRYTEAIGIEDLGGPIGRDQLANSPGKPEDVTLEKMNWKGFDIEVLKMTQNLNSISIVAYNAQVPLKPHAIQVIVTGAPSDEARLRTELHTILASINGRTNWLTEGQRADVKPNYIAVAVGLLLLIIGRLRIGRYYGLKGTGARIAGFFILVLGIAVPPLTVWVLRLLISLDLDAHSLNPAQILIGWTVVYGLAVWGAIVMLIKEHGNAYAKDEEEVAPAIQPLAQPPLIKRLISNCHMCQALIPPELQESVRSCPSCGADLSRAR